MTRNPDGIVLFSGGLDSLLVYKLLARLGLRPVGLHFYSPFFGSPEKVEYWADTYGIDVKCVDIGQAFTDMLAGVPRHGTGKTLNPCVDCKILLLREARKHMERLGARMIATGEVIGQRPMSQRRDTLQIIARDSGAQDYLLRPLSALLMDESKVEKRGDIRREGLLGISGRGRIAQLELAKELGISPVPGPGGGCLLTQRENARKFWPLLRDFWYGKGGDQTALATDFEITKLGRVLFYAPDAQYWVCIGRNEGDNNQLKKFADEGDIILKLPFPGPLALLRRGSIWPKALIQAGANILASFSGRARARGLPVPVLGSHDDLMGRPDQSSDWVLPSWEEVREEIREFRKVFPRF